MKLFLEDLYRSITIELRTRNAPVINIPVSSRAMEWNPMRLMNDEGKPRMTMDLLNQSRELGSRIKHPIVYYPPISYAQSRADTDLSTLGIFLVSGKPEDKVFTRPITFIAKQDIIFVDNDERKPILKGEIVVANIDAPTLALISGIFEPKEG